MLPVTFQDVLSVMHVTRSCIRNQDGRVLRTVVDLRYKARVFGELDVDEAEVRGACFADDDVPRAQEGFD